MSGAAVSFVAVSWTDERLPETFASSAALRALSHGEGFEAGLRRLLSVAFAAAVDPNPEKYQGRLERLDRSTFAVKLFGVDLAVSGGPGCPLTVLLVAELPDWTTHGADVERAAVADVQALTRPPSREVLN